MIFCLGEWETTISQCHFQFDVPFALGEILPRLQQYGFVAEGRSIARREIFLDSFDWRLFRQDCCLIESRGGGRRQLRWLSSGSGRCRAAANVKATPRFAADLPKGSLRDGLAPFLDIRALMPLAICDVRRRHFRFLNRDDKTVLRLVVEEENISSPGRRRGPATTLRIIRLVPVKGYDNALRQAVRWLQKDIGLALSGDIFPVSIFRALGLEPGAYSSKVDVALDTEMTAFEATRSLLANLWQAAEANEAGLLDDIDSEFLHDFRVAIRRTRSALSQLKDIFPEDWLARYRQEFAWLAAATGPTRDLDVYLLAIPKYEQLLPEEHRGGLVPLKKLIGRNRSREFKNLAHLLRGARYRALKEQWLQFVTTGLLSPAAAGAAAGLPVRSLAGRRIWRLYRKLLKGGRAITSQSPATDLHDLRKQAKKLRYMFEFFKSLYPDQEVAAVLKVMKMLQQNLGDIQDYEVQAEALAQMATELDETGTGDKASFLAIGMLTAHLMELQARARNDFDKVFADFDSPRLQQAFRKLFKDHSADGGSA